MSLLDCGLLLCKALKVTYTSHIWKLKIKWLWKHVSVAAFSLWMLSEILLHVEGGGSVRATPCHLMGKPHVTMQRGVEPCLLPALYSFPLRSNAICALTLLLWVCLLPQNVPRIDVAWTCQGNRCRNSFAVSLLQSPHHCALGHGTWKQSYQNKPFSYKLQVLKIHVIIVLSGSKCAYDAEREQIGLCLKQALPFS